MSLLMIGWIIFGVGVVGMACIWLEGRQAVYNAPNENAAQYVFLHYVFAFITTVVIAFAGLILLGVHYVSISLK